MSWLAAVFTKYPELAVFLAVGVGYWLGAFKFRGVGLGPVTCSLLAGCLIGYFFKVPVSSTAKSILFLLFLFSIGYSVGPRFFAAMKGDGLRWALLAVVMAFVGLGTAYAVARFLGLNQGFSAGLLSGSLTESPALGTAIEAIRTLPLTADVQERLAANAAVADSVCYLFGTLGIILFCSLVAPRLLGIDLAAEAEKVERELGIDRSKPGVFSAWRPFEMRAYRLDARMPIVGKTVAAAEAMVKGARLFIERIRRGGLILDPAPEVCLEAGDIVVVSGRREVLIETLGQLTVDEVADREALDVPVTSCDIFVTSEEIVNKSLEQIASDVAEVRGVFLRGIKRGGQSIPVAIHTTVQRGDVLSLSGPEPAVVRVARRTGRIVAPSDQTDFVTLGLGIFTGVLAGAVIVIPIGALRIPIGTSIGALIAGLVVGYLNSTRPLFGRIPDGALSLMNALGLSSFVAMVGLGAGPHFVDGLREAGVGLFFGGMVVTVMPLIAGLFIGRHVLKLNPLLLLGGIAGAQTMTAALAAVQERSKSAVAVLGYSGTVAVGHILLAIWGTVIVKLMT